MKTSTLATEMMLQLIDDNREFNDLIDLWINSDRQAFDAVKDFAVSIEDVVSDELICCIERGNNLGYSFVHEFISLIDWTFIAEKLAKDHQNLIAKYS